MRSDDRRAAVGATARESERDVSASFPYTALSPSLLDSLCRQCGHLCHLSFFFCHRSSIVWVQLQEAVQRHAAHSRSTTVPAGERSRSAQHLTSTHSVGTSAF